MILQLLGVLIKPMTSLIVEQAVTDRHTTHCRWAPRCRGYRHAMEFAESRGNVAEYRRFGGIIAVALCFKESFMSCFVGNVFHDNKSFAFLAFRA